jgi:predicted RNA binding protein YcfA (HicA-like mRNA interferase family)
MTRLPRISGTQCVRALCRAAFEVRRREGSHVTLRRDGPFAQVVVPLHKELDRGTLKAILRHANLSVEEFRLLLK